MAGSGAEAAVFARGLRKGYAGRIAVDGIDFEVRAGICFGFLGPNGAGKTTTMKMIYGLAAVEGGELRVLGLDARRQRREIKSRIGVVPQETNLDGDLTIRENLIFQRPLLRDRLPTRGGARRTSCWSSHCWSTGPGSGSRRFPGG